MQEEVARSGGGGITRAYWRPSLAPAGSEGASKPAVVQCACVLSGRQLRSLLIIHIRPCHGTARAQCRRARSRHGGVRRWHGREWAALVRARRKARRGEAWSAVGYRANGVLDGHATTKPRLLGEEGRDCRVACEGRAAAWRGVA
eukprot:scaffold57429_cov27-Tisochrysis_lutea.AAC.7